MLNQKLNNYKIILSSLYYLIKSYNGKLMVPQFVKPYVKTNKNDRTNPEAICEAVGRPNMRFVLAKSIEQQDILSMQANVMCTND